MDETAYRPTEATADQLRAFTWRVCMPARASSRLMFALMVALAAPVWAALGRRPACFHLYGFPPERDNLAALPASFYGWRLELTQWAAISVDPNRAAVGASEGLMVLAQDEEPHRMGMLNAIAALWGEHRGIAERSHPIKSRTDALTISVGDILINQALVFVAAPALRGGLRVFNIPADTGRGSGIYETPQAAGYSGVVTVALMKLGGGVGLHWLARLNEAWDQLLPAIETHTAPRPGDAAGAIDTFTQLPVDEIARGFRTIAAVGEVATAFGFTGWTPGDATEAVVTCERAWQAGNRARIDVATGRPP